MFKLIGVLVSGYALYALVAGKVVAKSGPWGRVVSRNESPRYFLVVIVIYLGLGAALVTWF